MAYLAKGCPFKALGAGFSGWVEVRERDTQRERAQPLAGMPPDTFPEGDRERERNREREERREGGGGNREKYTRSRRES